MSLYQCLLYCIELLFSESLIQTFRYYGFMPVAPGTHQLVAASDLMYLAYTMDQGSDIN